MPVGALPSFASPGYRMRQSSRGLANGRKTALFSTHQRLSEGPTVQRLLASRLVTSAAPPTIYPRVEGHASLLAPRRGQGYPRSSVSGSLPGEFLYPQESVLGSKVCYSRSTTFPVILQECELSRRIRTSVSASSDHPLEDARCSCGESLEHAETHNAEFADEAAERASLENALDQRPSSPWISTFSRLAACLIAFYSISLVLPKLAVATGVLAPTSGGTIASSSVGIKIASWLRAATGGVLPDEAIVMLLASLPVVELRGALPVAYWMEMTPVKAYILSVIGNMLPVPLILLFLGPLSEGLTSWSPKAKEGLDWVLRYTRAKADPIVEFQALGLMLFVAVPLPGTGAWSGAIAAHVLKLPFWEGLLANFFGVLLAGVIVSALCFLGLKLAVALAVALFFLSGVMWSVLRAVLPRAQRPPSA